MTETLEYKIVKAWKEHTERNGGWVDFTTVEELDKAIQELREEILKLELLYVNSADAFTIRRREVLALIGEKK